MGTGCYETSDVGVDGVGCKTGKDAEDSGTLKQVYDLE